MTDFPPWEPPLNGDEHAAVFAALDRLRVTFRWKAADLDAGGLAATTAASTMTLGGLLKHLALMEDHYFQERILGESLPAAWDVHDPDSQAEGWEWDLTEADTPESLYALWDGAASRSRAAVAEIAARGGLGAPAAMTPRDGSDLNVRRLVMDMIEEYGRHTGHADIIREAIDGRVGEDPPWPQ